MEKISAHISMAEAIKSQYATRHGIDNTPDDFELANMKLVAENCFEPARNHFGVPLFLSSFFRSEGLNEGIGGSKTSQHSAGQTTRLEESAIDMDQDGHSGPTNYELFNWLKDNVPFDQLIWEFDNLDNNKKVIPNSPRWVHIGYRKGANRNMVMQATRKNGRVSYIPYKD